MQHFLSEWGTRGCGTRGLAWVGLRCVAWRYGRQFGGSRFDYPGANGSVPKGGLLRNSISSTAHLVFGRQITSHRWFLKIWSDIHRPANLHAIRHRWGGHPGERDVQCAFLIGDVNAECLRISTFTEVAHHYVSRFVRFQKNSFNGLHVKQVVAAI